MSKFVKNLVTRDIQKRLAGVQDAVVANVVGMDSLSTFNTTYTVRRVTAALCVLSS